MQALVPFPTEQRRRCTSQIHPTTGQAAHCRRRHRDSKTLELAHDAVVAPRRILTRESQNQCSDLAADRRTAPVDARTSTASPPGRRCQASSVAGVTMNHGQPVQGKSRLPAASRILSTHARDDGFVAEGWRVSCCNTTMSSALKPCEPQRRQASRSTATKHAASYVARPRS